MAQILAVIIFVAMFALIVTEKIERHIVTLVCGLLVLVLVFGLVMHSPAAIWETLNLRAIWKLHYQASRSESGSQYHPEDNNDYSGSRHSGFQACEVFR